MDEVSPLRMNGATSALVSPKFANLDDIEVNQNLNNGTQQNSPTNDLTNILKPSIAKNQMFNSAYAKQAAFLVGKKKMQQNAGGKGATIFHRRGQSVMEKANRLPSL